MNYRTAKHYHSMGLPIFPLNSDKEPIVRWKKYQTTMPTDTEIARWWHLHPMALIAIVTGKLSGVIVVDADSEAGNDALMEYIPDSLEMPTVKTLRGWHYYFKYQDGIRNLGKFIKDCDLRGEGGYAVAPSHDNDKHWLIDLDGLEPPDIPKALLDKINTNTGYSVTNRSINSSNSILDTIIGDSGVTSVTSSNIFKKGTRDEDLFHLANHLVRGHMPIGNIREYLRFCALHSNPPYPLENIEAKIKSATLRRKSRDRNLTSEIKEYIELQHYSNFKVTNLYDLVTSATSTDRAKEKAKLLICVNHARQLQFLGRRPVRRLVFVRTVLVAREVGQIKDPRELGSILNGDREHSSESSVSRRQCRRFTKIA